MRSSQDDAPTGSTRPGWRQALLRGLAALGSTVPGHVPPPRADTLTTEQLLQEWDDSGEALLRQWRVSQVLAIVDQRQSYLDELERRDPAAFADRFGLGTTQWDDLTWRDERRE